MTVKRYSSNKKLLFQIATFLLFVSSCIVIFYTNMVLSFVFLLMSISSVSLILYLNNLTAKSNKSDKSDISKAAKLKLLESPRSLNFQEQNRQVLAS